MGGKNVRSCQVCAAPSGNEHATMDEVDQKDYLAGYRCYRTLKVSVPVSSPGRKESVC